MKCDFKFPFQPKIEIPAAVGGQVRLPEKDVKHRTPKTKKQLANEADCWRTTVKSKLSGAKT